MAYLLTVPHLHPYPFLDTKAILKCRFYYSNMTSPTDQRIIPIEKAVCCSQIPRGVAKPYHGVRVGAPGEATGLIRRQRERKKLWAKFFYYGFQGKEWPKQSNEQI